MNYNYLISCIFFLIFRYEWKDLSEDSLHQKKILTAENPTFGNNLNINGNEDQIPPNDETDQIYFQRGPIDCIIFLGIYVYNISNTVVRLILAVQSLFGNAIDYFIQRYISRCVTRSLTPTKISNLIEMLESMYIVFIYFNENCYINYFNLFYSYRFIVSWR